MNVNKLFDELLELKQQGFGEKEVVIWAEHPITKEKHHATIENTRITTIQGLSYLQYDKEQQVIELLP